MLHNTSKEQPTDNKPVINSLPSPPPFSEEKFEGGDAKKRQNLESRLNANNERFLLD